MESSEELTLLSFLAAGVNFPVPADAIRVLCSRRDVDPASPSHHVESDTIRLLHADLLRWIVLGAGRVGSVSDADNSWRHSEGGYTLSKDDKKLLIDEANAIYGELEPDSVFANRKIRMRSAGIMRAYTDTEGTPLPRRPI